MKRFLKSLIGVVPLLAAVAIQYVIVILFSIVYSAYVGFKIAMKQGTEGMSDSAELVTAIQTAMSQNLIYLISVFAVIVCGIVFFFWYRYEIRAEVRGKLKELFTKKNIAIFVLLGIGCQFFISGVMGLIEPYFTEVFEKYAETMEALLGGSDIIVLLLVVLVAPIAEELIFRGMILHKTNKIIPFLGANIMQAVLFGIYHMNIIQGIYATFLGLLLGLVYRKFKTIFAPIFLHMMVNASSFIIIFLPEAGYMNIVLLISGIVFVGITVLILMPFYRKEELQPIQEFAVEPLENI